VLCHWANAYNISEADLRAIVATFHSVFPHGTVWLVGGDDVLMLGSDQPLDDRLARLARHMDRPGVSADLASVEVRDAFSLLSLFIAGPAGLARYADGAAILTDDTMRLEFSAPRELHNQRADDNVASLIALGRDTPAPPAIAEAYAAAGAEQWRRRAAMLAKADVFGRANDDFLKALEHDPLSADALDGFVRTATVTGRASEALARLLALPSAGAVADRTPRLLVARSKLEAAAGQRDDALATARRATAVGPEDAAGYEQLASLYADGGDTVRLDEAVEALQQHAGPDAPATLYYRAVAALLHGNLPQAMVAAERGIGLHPRHAPLYDLAGAIYTKLGQVFRARWAFQQSLTFDAHDSTAYENLGLIALEEGDRAAARNYFAEALWLVPDSRVAREGLARTR
jgi:Flp pilus assembly protein TadD